MVGPGSTAYAGDLFLETDRYARLALAVARGESFGVVHAHDWMTFEAALAVAAAVHWLLVVQIHSTELDRAVPTPTAALWKLMPGNDGRQSRDRREL